MLPAFAAVILALGAALEILLAYDEKVQDVWEFHIIISASAGFILTLPLAYHAYKYRSMAQREIKEAEERLIQTTEYLMNVSDNLPLATLVLDKHKKIVFQNNMHKIWFGDGTGKSCEEFFKDKCRCDPCCADLLLKGERNATQHVMIGDRMYEIKASSYKPPGEEEMSLLEVFTDVTDFELTRRRLADMEQTISRTDKLATLGQLAAGVAHEINTPLANISLIAESLEKHVPSDEEKKKLSIIRGQVDTAAKTVRDLLSYIRTDISEPENVDVNVLVEETLWFVSQKRHTKITIDMKLANPSPIVKGNRGQIQQVFVNIISNAYDSMGESGTITISTGASENETFISVEDTGKGISPEDMKRLFQPFFTTKKGTGTGLGLTIANDIVERHRGRIKVESKPGKGSTFTIFLPSISG